MKRREFILSSSSILSAFNLQLISGEPFFEYQEGKQSLFDKFGNIENCDRPFVRWWWNGDKIERSEIRRELELLKNAGIGGVEINPIKFPKNGYVPDSKSIRWLSKEWVEILHFTLGEAKSLGLTCDLLVGSGWPFGAEWLEGDERSQIVSLAVKKILGPCDYEISLYALFKESDPLVNSPFPGRKMELMSVQLVPFSLNSLRDVIDVSAKVQDGTLRLSIPEGEFAVYACVLIYGFTQVIHGAPGAEGPVLNHYNEVAVKKYLNRMSTEIGTVSGKVRAFFADSLELEGANWCEDMTFEFQRRRGYDLMPFLPFVLFKTGDMGNVFDNNYGITYAEALQSELRRVRYDLELTKTELIRERFVETFINWCHENGVQSRMQAYGRGYHPLDGSIGLCKSPRKSYS